MTNEKIIEYIKKMLETNASEETIRTNLINSGFDQETINDSFDQALPISKIIIPVPDHQSSPLVNVIPDVPAPIKKMVTENKPNPEPEPKKEKPKEPNIFSPYSIILSVALLMCLCVIGHQAYADMQNIVDVTSRLAAEGMIIVPVFAFSLLAAGLIGNRKRTYQVLIFPYVIISGLLFLRLFVNMLSFLYDKNATLGFYVAIVLIVALLTGVGIYYQTRSHKIQ